MRSSMDRLPTPLLVVPMDAQLSLNTRYLRGDSLRIGADFAQQQFGKAHGGLGFFDADLCRANLFEPRPLFQIASPRKDLQVTVDLFRRDDHQRPHEYVGHRHQQVLRLLDASRLKDVVPR